MAIITDGGMSCEIEIPDREYGMQRIVIQMTSDSIERDMAQVTTNFNDGAITETVRDQQLSMLEQLRDRVWDEMEAILPAVIWEIE